MNRLGIAVAGLNGAVASTLVAGVTLMRRGLAKPTALISEPFRQKLRLAPVDALVFGGWDLRGENLFEAALRNAVLDPARLQPVAKELASVRPFGGSRPACNAMHSIAGRSRVTAAGDLDRFRRQHRLDTLVVLNLLPTGADRASRAYALAAAQTDCPFINFTPNDCGERKLAGIPYCGRDGKTGQTWLKSVLAPALRDRGLRITGWYSTNLLGNEDGKVVGDPEKGKAKIRDKSKLLAEMLGYKPHHQVQINFYPPRGDNKESWDNIDFDGFLGQPMQLKVNGLWRDSILAAAFCVDLIRFMDLAHRRGERGPQEWLSYYFKSPYARHAQTPPAHDFHKQERVLMQYLGSGRTAGL